MEISSLRKIIAIQFFSISLLSLITIQAQQPPVETDDDVVKITTDLIQIDVIVTDKKGNQISDLKADDFEILENNEKQEITNFSYISGQTPTAPIPTDKPKSTSSDKLLPPVPARIKPGEVRRTIALVVDDLGLSFSSIFFVRSALKKFVDEQMQPNDLVAIIRTGGGIGALQQFTSDKRILYAAIEKIRWNSLGRSEVGAFAPIRATFAEALSNQVGSDRKARFSSEDAEKERQAEKEFEQFREDTFSVGTLGAVNYIVRGMRELPGRKSILLFSDGFSIFTRGKNGNPESNTRILNGLRSLTESANRAAVAIYTADARGLVVPGFNAEDDLSELSPAQSQGRLDERDNELRDNQDGLNYLAKETGGRAFINSNNLNGMITKTLNDQNGYYLIGYQPDSETFDPKKRVFNKLMVRVKRQDVRVRYRSGFFGVTDDKARPQPTQNPRQQILNALTSPFGASEVAIKLNSIFVNDLKQGSTVRSFLHIQGSDLKFTEESNGWKQAKFEIVAITFGDNGIPIDEGSKTYTMRVSPETYKIILENGFVYNVSVPVKKSGAYQLRVALRDNGTGKVGAASQFIEVPDLRKNRLTISGIALQSFTREKWQKINQSLAKNQESTSEEDTNISQNDIALRRIKSNSILTFSYSIYNAKLDVTNKHPKIELQTRIFQDGKVILESKPQSFNLEGQTDFSRLITNGAILLGSKFKAGEYVLQIIATDTLAKEKHRIGTQWVDFEVID